MSRCPRCDACESHWTDKPCARCGYPEDDKRTRAQITLDDRRYMKRIENETGDFEI